MALVKQYNKECRQMYDHNWILSFHRYLMSVCKSNNLDTTRLQSLAVYQTNPKQQQSIISIHFIGIQT